MMEPLIITKGRENLKFKKVIVSLSIIAFMFFSMLFVATNNSVQGSSTLVEAQALTGVMSAVQFGTADTSIWSIGPSPNPINSTFKVDVRLDGATDDIWGWRVNVNWSSSVLNLTRVQQGGFFTDTGSSTLMVGSSSAQWDNVGGSIMGGLAVAVSSSLIAPDTETSGVLATLTFKVVGYGSGNITLTRGELRANSTHSPGTSIATNNATVAVAEAPPYLVDVFTSRGGLGLGANGGAYCPQELLKTYALVTYNGAPVINHQVSFLAKGPHNSTLTQRVATTNETGYAYFEYRLPWPDNNTPESIFGHLSIIGVANFADSLANDTVTFPFDYIVQVVNTSTGIQVPTSAQKQSTINVNITVQNIASAQPATLLITLYDETKVPISYTTSTTNLAPGITTIKTAVPIPATALAGNATVYINFLTDKPEVQGIPYCPEKMAFIDIVA